MSDEELEGKLSDARQYMARTIWKNRSWMRRLAWFRWTGDGECMPLDHGLYPESYFQEKLLQERRRALRSNKPLVVMLLNAEKICDPDHPGRITDSLSDVVHACVRESDICGLLKEDLLVGVILTEVEAEKVGNAQAVVSGKAREKLVELLSGPLADRVAISFHVFPSAGADAQLAPDSPQDLIAAPGRSAGKNGARAEKPGPGPDAPR
jgi:hypothetical protein